MAVSSCARVFPSFESRSDPDFSGFPRPEKPSSGRFSGKVNSATAHGTAFGAYGLSSLIFRFPPNFVRQLSTKARRNCSNIGVAQVVAASWSNNNDNNPAAAAAAAAAASSAAPVEVAVVEEEAVMVAGGDCCNGSSVQMEGSADLKEASFLSSDGSIAVHAGTYVYSAHGRGIVTDAITTPVVNTSAYFFKKTAELIDFKEKRHVSFEYGRYGNPTTVVAEEKISALEGAESTLIMASGMCA
ncbi:hypothetical protein L1049_003095 [Liquidambar formosana]|uniref:Cystathionine gamma-synthase n=1 Tax=Liquidambar formosana TaxID=63359 RepID=A0AAP0NGV5_LIQFO